MLGKGLQSLQFLQACVHTLSSVSPCRVGIKAVASELSCQRGWEMLKLLTAECQGAQKTPACVLWEGGLVRWIRASKQFTIKSANLISAPHGERREPNQLSQVVL